MPADLTIGGLRLAQTLPLMKPILIDVPLNTVIANVANQIITMSTITMPFFGDMVFQGFVNILVNAKGVQAIDTIGIHSTSVPSPTVAPTSIWRTEGGADVGFGCASVLAQWVGVSPGAVTPRLFLSNGSGGQSITVVRVAGIMYCTKT